MFNLTTVRLEDRGELAEQISAGISLKLFAIDFDKFGVAVPPILLLVKLLYLADIVGCETDDCTDCVGLEEEREEDEDDDGADGLEDLDALVVTLVMVAGATG